ncbi:YncE family protein [Scytonema sp. NUACC26]|uniref:YncE family protein n=1 Tax=Scytonema sp. NUACC26 TaxID=3140176 RepID=UPI0034DC9766
MMKKFFLPFLFFIGIVWVVFTQVPLSVYNNFSLSASAKQPSNSSTYEVWSIDQADSLDGTPLGGNLYVLSGDDQDFLTGRAKVEQINLAASAKSKGLAAGQKPHWIAFNTGAKYAIVGYATTAPVYAIDADRREVVDSILPPGLATSNSHTVYISKDNKFVFVADTPGQRIHKIATNYEAPGGKIFGEVKTLDFNVSETKTALGTPTARPVVAVVDDSGQFMYVTFADGGVAIVNAETLTIAHIYTKEEVTFNGLLASQVGDSFITNAGNADPQIADFVYVYDNKSLLENPSKRPDFIKVPQSGNDVHGAVFVRDKYLWQLNRASNTITIHEIQPNLFDPDIDGSNKVRAVNLVELTDTALGPDPAPDIIETSPSQEVAFISQRGPNPISGNDPAFFNSVGATPGIGVVQIKKDGQDAKPVYLYRFDNVVNGVNIGDFHALTVRK